ncbi:MAG: hypothetical protein ABIV48_05615 [Pyrinomonadaceae bacterium]
MDFLLLLIWVLIAAGYLGALIASWYYVYIRGGRPFDIFAKLIAALIVYGLLTFITGFLVGIVGFIGAHAKPPGSILGTSELLIGAAILIVFAASGWLTCSFISGRLLYPARKFNASP